MHEYKVMNDKNGLILSKLYNTETARGPDTINALVSHTTSNSSKGKTDISCELHIQSEDLHQRLDSLGSSL